MYIEWLLVYLLSVWANKELVKDILTCRPLESSVFKSCHPDDTDNLDVMGVSSEDEAEEMEDILGVSRRLNTHPLSRPSPSEPPTPEVEEGFTKVPKKDLEGPEYPKGYPGWEEGMCQWSHMGRCPL